MCHWAITLPNCKDKEKTVYSFLFLPQVTAMQKLPNMCIIFSGFSMQVSTLATLFCFSYFMHGQNGR